MKTSSLEKTRHAKQWKNRHWLQNQAGFHTFIRKWQLRCQLELFDGIETRFQRLIGCVYGYVDSCVYGYVDSCVDCPNVSVFDKFQQILGKICRTRKNVVIVRDSDS